MVYPSVPSFSPSEPPTMSDSSPPAAPPAAGPSGPDAGAPTETAAGSTGPADGAASTEPKADASAAKADAKTPSKAPPGEVFAPPSYFFLGGLSIFVLVADLWSKAWALKNLEKAGVYVPPKEVIKNHLSFVLARNPGGAFGMFHDQPEKVRKPFFVLVSIVAVAVIISMFRKLDPKQRALKWGLPLVLGGALGNLADRIRSGKVVDFIDYRADWILSLNKLFVKLKIATNASDHWPTFNVADIAICIGVALMAIDFLFPRKRVVRVVKKKAATAETSAEKKAT